MLVEMASQVRDWQEVAAGAVRHRIVPLLLAAAARDGGGGLPANVHKHLIHRHEKQVRAALAQTAEVVRLNALLSGAGIDALFLKGVVLSQLLYEDVSVRGVGDIDLLVEPGDFLRAEALLVGGGYVTDGVAQPDQRELCLRHPDNGQLIELHQRLSINPARLDVPFRKLWQERQTVRLGSSEVPTLPARLLALYLVAHGSEHCWERLCWVADIAGLLTVPDAAERMLLEARSEGLEKAMQLALLLAHHWLGRALPQGLLEDMPAQAMYGRFERRFFGGDRWREAAVVARRAPLRRRMLRRHFLYSLKSGWSYRLAELAADLNDPVHRHRVKLPRGWTWAYPLLRPFGRFFWRPPSARRGRN